MERQSKIFAIVGSLIIIFLVFVLVFKRPIPVEQPVDEPVVTEQTEIEEQEKPMTDIPVEEEEDKRAVILELEIANQSLIDENEELKKELSNLVKSVNLLRVELGLPKYTLTLPKIEAGGKTGNDPGNKTGTDYRDDRYLMIELELRQKELLEEKEDLQDEKDFLLESIATMKLELGI